MKVGNQTIKFKNSPKIFDTSSIVGPKEMQGPLANEFDMHSDDIFFGEKTFEKAESRMMNNCINNLFTKTGMTPEKIDYIINLVGGPEKNEKIFNQKNRKPAEVMLRIAEEKNVRAMGFIGGKLGPKAFVEVKKELIEKLSKSRIRLEYVEPTIVYGNGRNDTLAKLIPIFKFLGLFNKNMKPVQVDDIVRELVSNLEGK